MQFRCPNCHNPIQIAQSDDDETFKLLSCPSCNSKINFGADPTETIIPGQGMVIAHYEVRQVLGYGSYGTVYEAWDTELERKVAIKVPRNAHNSPATNQAFLREARSAASVTHPNVVAIYELGQHNESVYIASEFIDGVELGDLLRQQTSSQNDYAAIMIKLLRAAHVFHENGVVHRDLKPGNILIDKAGEPHITDFGLARRETGHEVTVTQSGRVIGTPAFMPPEQARGDTAAISPLSDVYSLGVILYAMLTGKRPFNATETRPLLYAILTSEPLALRKINADVSRDLETICLKAISKAPSQRYQSAAEFADDLQRHLDGEPILARPASSTEKAWKRIRRYPAVSSLTAVVSVLLLALGYQWITTPPLSPAETPQQVEFNVVSATGSTIQADSGVRWAFAKLDEFTREPILETKVTARGGYRTQQSLVPGEYLVVVEVAGLGFQEAYRTVPINPASDQLQPIYRHQRWNYNATTGTTVLPTISVFDHTETISDMVLVPEGDFTMGDGSDQRPKHPKHIDRFYVDPTEVSIAEFEADGISKLSVDYQDNFAACNISWHGAAAWAERHGQRLLTEAEYEYLATNLGRSNYPAGTDAPYDTAVWPYGPVGEPAYDCIPDLNIFGLHSNVAEWTSSTHSPYPGGRYYHHLRQKVIDQRIIRGGPSERNPIDRTENTWTKSTRYRSSHHAADFFHDEVGFRCAVGLKPSLLEASSSG